MLSVDSVAVGLGEGPLLLHGCLHGGDHSDHFLGAVASRWSTCAWTAVVTLVVTGIVTVLTTRRLLVVVGRTVTLVVVAVLWVLGVVVLAVIGFVALVVAADVWF